MKKYYYVGKDNNSYGPISPDEFLNYGLTTETLVCPEGGTAWVPLRTVPGLSAYVQGNRQCPPQTPYGAPGAQGGDSNRPSYPPSNYMVWAILTTIFCCLPFGVVAIIKASEVNSLWYAGLYDDAMRASNAAKNWCVYSLVASVSAVVLFFLFNMAAIAALL